MIAPTFRALSVVAVITARACGADEPTPPPSVSVDAPPASVAVGGPQEHGTVVAVGPASVEVVPHASGQVYAYPKTGIATPASANLQVTVAVRDGTRAVPMVWVERNHRYEGRVVGATIVPGPTNVTIVIGGATYVGAAVLVVIAPAIRIDVHEYWSGKHKHRGHGHAYGHGNGRTTIRIH